MNKTNPQGALYYAKTGRPATIIETLPVVKFRVQFSNGNIAEMTQEQLDEQFTNTRPAFMFDTSFAGGHLRVAGNERSVSIKVRRKYGDYPGQDLHASDVMALYDRLGQWLADRMPAPPAMAGCAQSPDPAMTEMTATEAMNRAHGSGSDLWRER